MKVVAIVQARMGSLRLPNKVMLPLSGDMTMIEVLLKRLSESKQTDEIVLATSIDKKNDSLSDHVTDLGYQVYRGSESDVLDRYYKAAKQYNATVIVRITGDCPLIDHEVVDSVIKLYKLSNSDYVSNVMPPTYPDGLDVEVFSFESLEYAWKNSVLDIDREHVTPFIEILNCPQ